MGRFRGDCASADPPQVHKHFTYFFLSSSSLYGAIWQGLHGKCPSVAQAFVTVDITLAWFGGGGNSRENREERSLLGTAFH